MRHESDESGLDQPCAACGRTSGDHTLREWAECIGTATTDLPYAQTPDDMAQAAADAVRRQFQLDPDLIVADHVVIRAVTLSGAMGIGRLRLPALLHDFQIGLGGRPPVTIAKVAFLVGNESQMRAYGRLVRDSAYGAANAAEGRSA